MGWFRARKSSTEVTTGTTTGGTLIVRSGQDSAYYHFMEIYTHTNGLTLTVDRRRAERRASPADATTERRAVDRRSAPPATWELGDCVLAPSHTAAAGAPDRSQVG